MVCFFYHEEKAHQKVLKLWTLEADTYLHRHVVSMYTLLPAMKGITASMLLQAISEMEQAYTREDLIQHLRRFKTILHRSRTLTEQDKRIVEAKMDSYDSLLEGDPEIQKMRAESEVKGKQDAILLILETRFPTLVETARQQVVHVNTLSELNLLIKLIVGAPDEKVAEYLLLRTAA